MTNPSAASPSAAQSAARIGRRAGITTFWCMAVFVVGMSSRSVIGHLYGSSQAASAEQEAQCAQQLRALESSLREHAADELRLNDDPARATRWLGAWDRDYTAIGPCGSLEDARLALGDLRARTAAMLLQHTRRSAPLTERIERALDRFDPRPSSRPPKET